MTNLREEVPWKEGLTVGCLLIRLAPVAHYLQGIIINLAPVRQAFEFAPPLIIQKEEIDKALEIINECITEEEK